jgi:hypothetical protein
LRRQHEISRNRERPKLGTSLADPAQAVSSTMPRRGKPAGGRWSNPTFQNVMTYLSPNSKEVSSCVLLFKLLSLIHSDPHSYSYPYFHSPTPTHSLTIRSTNPTTEHTRYDRSRKDGCRTDAGVFLTASLPGTEIKRQGNFGSSRMLGGPGHQVYWRGIWSGDVFNYDLVPTFRRLFMGNI